MRYRACQGKLEKKQMVGRWRETKSTGTKSSVRPLQPVQLERLQEAATIVLSAGYFLRTDTTQSS